MGMDEKQAFTLVPSISASGELLPIQTIFHGQTTTSCPSPRAHHYTEADQRGFKFEPLLTHTYWSTQATMKSLVNDMIAPYFDAKKTELGLPPSVMKVTYPLICFLTSQTSYGFHTYGHRSHRPKSLYSINPLQYY
jgi:hypothetical protein